MCLLWFRQLNTIQNLEKKNGDDKIKVPDFSGVATTAVLNLKISKGENKIPDVNDLVKKTDYYAKIKKTKENISLLLMVVNLWQ